ncbi:hypothetical protein NL676_003078 [Syzygium grande]|nr:hypothetical protein NL676_003078 [Syzygium grande]
MHASVEVLSYRGLSRTLHSHLGSTDIKAYAYREANRVADSLAEQARTDANGVTLWSPNKTLMAFSQDRFVPAPMESPPDIFQSSFGQASPVD